MIAEYDEPHENLALLSSLQMLVVSHGSLGAMAAMLGNHDTLLYPAYHGEEKRYGQHSFYDSMQETNAVPISFRM